MVNNDRIQKNQKNGLDGPFVSAGLSNFETDKEKVEEKTSITFDLTENSDVQVFQDVLKFWKEETITFTFTLRCVE